MNEFLTACRHVQQDIFGVKIYSPKFLASFGTFWTQIGQLFEAQWVFRGCFKIDKSLLKNRFRLINDFPILISHLYLLRHERKGGESACVKWRKQRGREVYYPNGPFYQKENVVGCRFRCSTECLTLKTHCVANLHI